MSSLDRPGVPHLDLPLFILCPLPLLFPLLLFLEQDPFDVPHLIPYPDAQNDRDDKDNAEHDGLGVVALVVLDEEHAKVDEEDLLR